MFYIFLLILLVSPIHLIVGLINPRLAFFNQISKATRLQASLLSLGLLIGSFVGAGVTAPNPEQKQQVADSESTSSRTASPSLSNQGTKYKGVILITGGDFKENKEAWITETSDRITVFHVHTTTVEGCGESDLERLEIFDLKSNRWTRQAQIIGGCSPHDWLDENDAGLFTIQRSSSGTVIQADYEEDSVPETPFVEVVYSRTAP